MEQMAAAFPDSNYIGVEIREQFVEEALARTADQRLKEGRRNLAYLTANVLEGTAMSDILSSMQRAGMKVHAASVSLVLGVAGAWNEVGMHGGGRGVERSGCSVLEASGCSKVLKLGCWRSG